MLGRSGDTSATVVRHRVGRPHGSQSCGCEMNVSGRGSVGGDPLGPVTRGPLATLAVLIIAAAIVIVGGFGLLASQTPQPSASPALVSPSASGDVTLGDWATLGDLPPLEPVADLVPTVADRAGIAPDSAFTLTSLDGTAAMTLAGGLAVEPPLVLRPTAGTTTDTVTVTPAEPLLPGQRYRFALRTPDDALVGTWAFTVKAPLHVVTMLPDDQSTGVPLDTGIELTFDQDTVTGAQERFSIEPVVDGRFETHGRTVVFVPSALAARTLYTVTLDAGVGVEGSDVTLQKPVRLRFETTTARESPKEALIVLGRTIIESDPGEPPVIALTSVEYDEEGDENVGGATPDRLPVEIYRLPDLAAALDAARTLADAPQWATTEAGLVATDGLERVLATEVGLQQVGDAQAIVLPDPLPRGSYLLVVPRQGRDAQALLQVTDLASYSLVSPTSSLVWVQRIGGGPVAGVDVALADGSAIGTTDRRGLLEAATPTALLRSDDATVLLTLRAPDGEMAIVPLGLTSRVQAYPQDIHGTIDETLIDVLAPDGASRWSPWFALAARTAPATEALGASSETLAATRAVDGDVRAILADTMGEGGGGSIEDDRFWTILSTDREAYRQTDTIHLWGYLRDRDSMRVPADVRLRLLVADSDEFGPVEEPALETAVVDPASSGAFEASFALKDVPLGSYRVELEVAGHPVASRWLSVTVIRKPAYELDVSLDRHVRIDGQSVVATASARFFEGTVAPGVDVAMSSGHRPETVVTGPAGSAAATLGIRHPAYDDGLTTVDVEARVVGAEEGEITASDRVLVLPASRWLTGTSSLDGDRLRLEGTVSNAAIKRLERQFAALDPDQWVDELDPTGSPIAGARVTLEVERLVITRTLSQQNYDFITKRVVPIYDEETRYVPVATRSVRTDGDGRYRLSVRVPSRKATYRVRLRTNDGSGRTMAISLWASPPEPDTIRFPSTTLDAPARSDGSAPTYGTGDRVVFTLMDQDGVIASRDAGFLFVTAQRGLRDAAVQDTAFFRRQFQAADAPGLFVEGVHFTGRTFVHSGRWATFDPAERQLTVRLETDRARYRPGQQATITITTSDSAGRPVPASVVLRGVDEKLFRIGAVAEEDPLGQLYEPVSDGLYRSYTSHPLPQPNFGDGGGDTGGGGRDDFRDTLVYQLLETGPDGVGTATLQLADDLTSWHLSASAVTAGLEVGVGSTSVPVGLPFFVEATLAPEFVLADEPVLRLRAYGSELERGDRVSFTVASPTLGSEPTTVTAGAFTSVDVPLPALQLGEQRLVIQGSARNGALSDKLTRTFRVIPARASRSMHAYATLEAERGIESGPGLTTVVVSDAGRGAYLAVLEELAWSDGPRLDQALSAIVARDLLVERFGLDAAAYPVPSFTADAYQRGDQGLALLAYGSASHDITVRALLADPTRFDTSQVRDAMRVVLTDSEATRERQIMALAGLALLGDEVLDAVRSAATLDDLTVRERLYLALATSTLGDQATAIELERALVAERGERRGPWIRIVEPGSSDESVEATALLAIVMAEVGDPLADEAEAYVEANPLRDDLNSLQRLAYAERALERAPTAASRVAMTVGGVRNVVDLEPGASRTLTLTEPQARSLRLEPLAGTVGVSVTRQEPLEAATTQPDPALSLTRTITPAGPIQAGQVVTVELGITFGSQALKGCTEVVDQVPSGLVVSEWLAGWEDEEDDEDGAARATVDALSPDTIAGQRVGFCASPDPKRSVILMRYHARVIGPGTYVWEPASAQSAIASELTTLTPAASIELR